MTETSTGNRISAKRRKRINRLKKMILTTILLAILLPVLGCGFLGVRLFQAKKQVTELGEQFKYLEKRYQEEKDKADRLAALLEMESGMTKNQEYLSEAVKEGDTIYVDMSENVYDESTRRVYLTFDDGPSDQTEKILDILNCYHIKATFFVVGKPDEKYESVYRRIVEEGHTLGMHSYSHSYQSLYASLDAFSKDLTQLQDYLYQLTGIRSKVYRFPGGSSNRVSRTDMQQLIKCLGEQDIVYYDWNVSAGDATAEPVSSDRIAERVCNQVSAQQSSIVLMHDASDKKSTVEALPMIIEEIQSMENTVILPITEATIPIQHLSPETEDDEEN